MKTITKIPLLATSVLTVLGAAPINRGIIANGVGILSGFTSEANLDYDLSLFSSGGDANVELKVYNARTNALVVVQNYPLTLPSNESENITITLPLKNRLKDDGLKIELEFRLIKDRKRTSGIIYPYFERNYNANDYKRNPLTISGVIFNVKKSEIVTEESFYFSDTVDYLSRGDRNNIDFSEVYFNYEEGFDFNCDAVEYHIKDYANIYPHLKKTNDEIVLMMKYEQNGSTIGVSLNEKLYVNQESLDMAYVKLPGYVATRDLYLPVGKESDFANDDSYILLKGAGHSKCNISIPFTFYLYKKLLGQCYEADYCITGGILE